MNILRYSSGLLIILLAIEISYAQDYCSVQTNSGLRSISYNDFYLDMYGNYKQHEAPGTSRYLKNLYSNYVKGYLEACPDFYQKILKDALPSIPTTGGSTAGNLLGVLLNESLQRDSGFKKIKNDHPYFKAWIKRLMK